MQTDIENECPKYFVRNPIFENMFTSSEKMFSNEIDERFLIKITHIKNIIKELYSINKNLNNPRRII
jgi:hypothetical protein